MDLPAQLAAARGQLVSRLQLISAGLYSLGHGGNDAQKTIGIICMLLIATGYSAAGDSIPASALVVGIFYWISFSVFA